MQMNRPCPYLDDIFQTFDKCLQILDEIFERPSEAGMQLNLDKSHIMAIQVELLGFILMRTGAKPIPKRIEAILKLAPPENVRGCWRIIGIINFIKNHITMRAALMQHLTELTRKDTKYKWNKHKQKEFDKLKVAVANSTYSYHLSRPYQAIYVLITRTRHRNMRAAGCCAKSKTA